MEGRRVGSVLVFSAVILVTFSVVLSWATPAREFEERGTLSVGRERKGEQLVLGSRRGASYHIAGLRPGASYEARISYPATNPAVFTVMFAPDFPREEPGVEKAQTRGGSSRSLLNVVQRRFVAPVTVPEPGRVTVPLPDSYDDGIGFLMFVYAVREGVLAPDVKDDGVILYNIVVEELALPGLGGVPGGAWGVAALSVALFVVAAYGATKLRHLLLLRPHGTKQQ